MKYSWILFDADETLFRFDSQQGLRLMFSRYGVDFSDDDYQQYQLVNQPLWVDYQDGKIDAQQLQVQRFSHWALRLGIAADRLNSAYLAAMGEICDVMPGARELITALQDKVKLGIITNGFTDLQTLRLARTGMKEAFSALVISEQVGVAKPDIAIFEYAFSLMGYPQKEQILMVGDNPHADILGGMNAGIDTCWINTQQTAAPEGITPNYQVRSLPELQHLLLAG